MINFSYLVLIIVIALFLFKQIAAESPCSVWSEHPELCNSDDYR